MAKKTEFDLSNIPSPSSPTGEATVIPTGDTGGVQMEDIAKVNEIEQKRVAIEKARKEEGLAGIEGNVEDAIAGIPFLQCGICDYDIPMVKPFFKRSEVEFYECPECKSCTAANPRPSREDKIEPANHAELAVMDTELKRLGRQGRNVTTMFNSIPYLESFRETIEDRDAKEAEELEGIDDDVPGDKGIIYICQLRRNGQAWNQLTARRDIVLENGYRVMPTTEGIALVLAEYGYKLISINEKVNSLIFEKE